MQTQTYLKILKERLPCFEISFLISSISYSWMSVPTVTNLRKRKDYYWIHFMKFILKHQHWRFWLKVNNWYFSIIRLTTFHKKNFYQTARFNIKIAQSLHQIHMTSNPLHVFAIIKWSLIQHLSQDIIIFCCFINDFVN